MKRFRNGGTVAAAIVAISGCAAGAAAQTSWLNPASGLWSDPANWTAGIPNSAGVIATIGVAGAYTVQQNASYSVGTLNISNPNATVTIDPGQSLSVHGAIQAAGLLLVNSTGANSTSQLLLSTSTTFSGGGRVRLNAFPANIDTARILRAGGGIDLTNATGHTIDGVGNINGVPFSNAGMIEANVPDRTLQILSLTAANTATIRGTNSGNLQVNSSTINQSGAGQLRADGGRVTLLNATVNGGLLTSSGGGTIDTVSGWTSAVNDVTLGGSLRVVAGSILTTGGTTLVNNATVTVNPEGINSTAQMNFGSAVTVSGSGSFVLNANENNNDSARIVRSSGIGFTNGAGHTIRGAGNINGAPFTNAGMIEADVPDRTLQILSVTAANTATIRGTNSGNLQINSSAINQSGAGQLRADGGRITLVSSTVNGGLLTSSGGGTIQTLSGWNSWVNDVTLGGSLRVVAGSTLTPGGTTLVNNATVTVNPEGINNTAQIHFGSTVAVSGSGSFVLNANENNNDSARIIRAGGGIEFTNAAGHTIRGAGDINGIPFTNQGLIHADIDGRSLRLLNLPAVNNATMRAGNNASLLLLSTSVNQSGGGSIIADGGQFLIQNSSVTGGSISTLNGGVARNLSGWTGTLSGVTLSGHFAADHGSTVSIPAAGLVNNGVLTVNLGGMNSTAQIHFTETATLSGTGTLVLNAFPGNNDSARIIRAGGGIEFTNAAGHTIRGAGDINGIPFTNQGLIHADIDGRSLRLLNLPAVNNATMRAGNNASLLLLSTSVNQSGGGSIIADGGQFLIQNGFVTGGSISTLNGGVARNLSGWTGTLSGVTLSGHFAVDHGSTVDILAAGIVNNGALTVNTTATNSTASLQISGTTTLQGSGSVVLNANPANNDTARIVRLTGGIDLTNGQGHTISGRGNINGCPITNAGILAPGFPASAATINVFNVPYVQTPTGILRVKLGGTGAGQSDRLNSNSTIALNGALEASLFNGYLGNFDDAITIVSAAAVSGVFSSYSFPDDPSPGTRWAVQYTPTSVLLRVVCNPDFNGDGQVDFFDYLDFVQALNSEDARGDYNRDGQIDFFDYLDFVNDFATGC